MRIQRAVPSYDVLTDIQATRLGFAKTAYRSHKQVVYQKGNCYISFDIDGHRGGTWKMADGSWRRLGNQKQRLGTYNNDLTVRKGN
jgi:filamentous hemagglutinin